MHKIFLSGLKELLDILLVLAFWCANSLLQVWLCEWKRSYRINWESTSSFKLLL